MTNQETLELALNALKCLFGLPDKFTGEGGDVAVWRLGGSYRAQEAIKALEDALAKQEQGEPVAWNLKDVTDAYKLGAKSQQRTWVGLTDDDVDLLEELYAPPVHPNFVNDADHCLELIRHVEAKLKEKNT